jgi:hypothetical protein
MKIMLPLLNVIHLVEALTVQSLILLAVPDVSLLNLAMEMANVIVTIHVLVVLTISPSH